MASESTPFGLSNQGITKIETAKIKDHFVDLMSLKGIEGVRKPTFEAGSFNLNPNAPPLSFQCDIPIYFASKPDFTKRLWFDKQMDITPLLKK